MILIGLGSNLNSDEGHAPSENLARAISMLKGQNIEILQVSPYYESEPVPNDGSPWYINAVAQILTKLAPDELLSQMLEIEAQMGRVRTVANAPRVVDLDLLAYNSDILETDRLTLPHPRMLERRFVLLPLADIAPHWRHPIHDVTAVDCLSRQNPGQKIRRMNG